MSYRNSNFNSRSRSRRGGGVKSLTPSHGSGSYLTTAELSKMDRVKFRKNLDRRTAMQKPIYGPTRARNTIGGALINPYRKAPALIPDRPVRSSNAVSRYDSFDSPPETVDLYHKAKYMDMNPVAESLGNSMDVEGPISDPTWDVLPSGEVVLAHTNLRTNQLSYSKRKVVRDLVQVAKRIKRQTIVLVGGKRQFIHSIAEGKYYASLGYNSYDIIGDQQYVKRSKGNPLVPITLPGGKKRITQVCLYFYIFLFFYFNNFLV